MRIPLLPVMIFMLFFAPGLFAQKADSAALFHVNSGVTVTNKGISLIPTFTLGKPAAIFDLSLGKRKLFFEPQLRFALNGRPWSFIFWWRYHLVNTTSFRLNAGLHPSIVFKTVKETVNGKEAIVIHASQYLAAELSPAWQVKKNLALGIYYLYSHGVSRDAVRNTHFITLNGTLSGIRLGNTLTGKINPQLYYLEQDQHDGFFITTAVTVSSAKLPLAVQYLFNKKLEADIPGSRDFISSFSLIYTVQHTYTTSK